LTPARPGTIQENDMRRLIAALVLGLAIVAAPTTAQAATHNGVTTTERLPVCTIHGGTVYRVRVVNHGDTQAVVKAVRDVRPDRPYTGSWADLRYAYLAPGQAKVFRFRIGRADAGLAFSVTHNRHVLAADTNRRDVCL
jgi:hypothetical protein